MYRIISIFIFVIIIITFSYKIKESFNNQCTYGDVYLCNSIKNKDKILLKDFFKTLLQPKSKLIFNIYSKKHDQKIHRILNKIDDFIKQSLDNKNKNCSKNCIIKFNNRTIISILYHLNLKDFKGTYYTSIDFYDKINIFRIKIDFEHIKQKIFITNIKIITQVIKKNKNCNEVNCIDTKFSDSIPGYYKNKYNHLLQFKGLQNITKKSYKGHNDYIYTSNYTPILKDDLAHTIDMLNINKREMEKKKCFYEGECFIYNR